VAGDRQDRGGVYRFWHRVGSKVKKGPTSRTYPEDGLLHLRQKVRKGGIGQIIGELRGKVSGQEVFIGRCEDHVCSV